MLGEKGGGSKGKEGRMLACDHLLEPLDVRRVVMYYLDGERDGLTG